MTAAVPDTPETRAALALPTQQAAAALGIHHGSVRRLRKRMGVEPPVEAPMPVLVLRIGVELRDALERESKRRRVSIGRVAREWMERGRG